ncbi:Voltage-dependent calcium channel subunit alpha-2/delta-1 [Stylophora pistillata]|uniref:Voltage-dependent calcium channel subunit alpha-2/delta-1 n=1 Tax=Stylophora pistillata TaxID=50429 RepID=A0A2B4SS93_STYPI|nr:Voltage-dependent calcium channel subunit alpha-2/delta-1 [Stylophora pistillata]
MAVNLTRLLALFSVFCVLAETAGSLSIDDVKSWAGELRRNLSGFFNDTTQYNKIQEEYRQSELSALEKNGSAIAEEMKKRLERILQEKIDSIKNLAAKAAELRKNYTYKTGSVIKETEYFDTKNLQDLALEKDPKFSDKVAINKSSSVVHIPTDVYEGGVKILNTINWTDGLDKYFKENEQKDHTLLWQYFGSSDGVYRVYIQGSSAPKDLILVLDLSGSMAGQKLSILKLAALSLLETLQENDFVNIVAVYKGAPVMLCQLKKNKEIGKSSEKCSKQLLQATTQNKKFLQQFIPHNTFAMGIANASSGFQLAIDVLKDSREKNYSSSDCTQAIILFTDGMEESQFKESTKIFNKENKEKKIHVFTYLVGSEKGAKYDPLEKISISNGGCPAYAFYEKTKIPESPKNKCKTPGATGRCETTALRCCDPGSILGPGVTLLSRPLAFVEGGPDTSWTPIYLDGLGLGLMITLVAPVFNITSPEDKGQLLGVVGTDVALPQLEGTVPLSDVGVNGYGFAINNNGFVLFHPGLDKKWFRKFGEPPKEALADNKVHRLSLEQNFSFFYSPVDNTSFSAAVAIPEYGLKYLQAKDMDLKGVSNLSDSKGEDVIVAPWDICPTTPVAAKDSMPVYKLSTANAKDIIDDQNRTNNSEPFTTRDYMKEQFYRQAAQYAQKGENIIVFSVPYRGKNKGNQPTCNESIVINASSAIVKEKVVAAVAGMQFDQEKMQEIFNNSVGSQTDCQEPEVSCRLIDDDGFILASIQKDEVGEFFGVPEGAVLKYFLKEERFKDLFLRCHRIYSSGPRRFFALAEEEEEMKIPCTQELKFYKGVSAESLSKAVSSATEPRLLFYRKPPELESLCKAKGEGKPPCASASLCSAYTFTLLILLAFSLLIPTNHHGR